MARMLIHLIRFLNEKKKRDILFHFEKVIHALVMKQMRIWILEFEENGNPKN